MTGKRKSFRIAIVMLGLIVPMLMVQAVSPSAAQARCKGEGSGVTSTLNEPNGDVAMYEQAISGTCNRNNVYSFRFRSNVEGWRATVFMYVRGGWQERNGGYDQSWHNASFSDSNSFASMYYCIDNGDASNIYCGVGDNGGFFFVDTRAAAKHQNWGF